jgi:hypothetical protein
MIRKNMHTCSVQMQFFFQNTFDPWLVESVDAETLDSQG